MRVSKIGKPGRIGRLTAVAAAVVLATAACSGDDGGDVRSVGEGSASGTASGSGTGHGTASGSGTAAATGPASGSATDTATGTATDTAPGAAAGAECDPVGDFSAADTRVAVTLSEWIVEPDPTRAPAGTVGFAADNVGGMAHELVVVRAESVESLPTDDDGAVDESALDDGALVGEIGEFPSGETCEGAFELEAGDYVLFCNIVEEQDEGGEVVSHFAEGMATTFTVE